MIGGRHAEWREFVRKSAGTGDIRPNPYWTYKDILKKLGTKLNNLMYVKAETKRIEGEEYFRYREFEAYINPTLERFLSLAEDGAIYVDFDARSGHNHGTKFRIRPERKMNELYTGHIIVESRNPE